MMLHWSRWLPLAVLLGILTGIAWAEEAPRLPDYISAYGGPPLHPYVAPTLVPYAPPRPPEVVPPVALVVPVPAPGTPPRPRFDVDGPVGLTIAYPAAEGQIAEGMVVTLVWNTGGPIHRVRISYDGELCRLGGRSRGTFDKDVATVDNVGTYRWKVPWMDAASFRLRVVGLSDKGQKMTADTAKYEFLPVVCQNRPATAICVSKAHQRLYYLSEGRIRRMHIVSTAAQGFVTPTMKPGSYDRERGAMGKVFHKSYAPTSRMYEVVMYYWLAITSSGSHGIHATSASLYRRLGHPASHGCVRQHRDDAKALWQMVSVGTPVYVL